MEHENLTLTDFVNMEAARRKVNPEELYRLLETKPLLVIYSELFSTSPHRFDAEEMLLFQVEQQNFDAVVNRADVVETGFLGITRYYHISALGVKVNDSKED
ncbi:hypothetical protein HYT57_02770 [Candidatus Woesearchaeota archaeon]|nr:hypothetical protein [Candidatus Woesearchaeota archaeon]